LRAMCGLSKSQFSMASGALAERGLIEVDKAPNAASTVFVLVPNSDGSENRNTRNSELGTPEIRNSEVPNSGTPLYIGSSKSAPKSTKGVSGRANSHKFWSEAIGHGAHHHDGGVRMDGERIVLVNGTRAEWLEKFDGDENRLDLALLQVAGFIQPNSSRPLSAQVSSQLARIAGQRHDQTIRYEATRAKAQRAGPQQTGKRTLADALRDAAAKECA